ncbi:uncharacterized protein IWZ02DRAFT_459772 [Phyllosticta citriasiana]|uniref:Uncharacterized protein n=1 Tax=Phyllosticta citriasiana TaxID=595635 RepID=A0ABR1K847_9PEZI
MLLSRRALPLTPHTPWRAAIARQRRWYTPNLSRTLLVHDSRLPDKEILRLISQQAPASYNKNHKVEEPLFVLVSTPSLASRFSSPSGPTPLLKSIVDRFFAHSLKHSLGVTISGIRVLSAVVDALPAPKPGYIAEGISYVLLVKSEPGEKADVDPDEVDHDELGTLEFRLTDKWYDNKMPEARPRRGLGRTHHRVAIKLANTLFQSGRKKTMLDVKYLVDPTGDLHLAHHEWLAHCSIPYHFGDVYGITDYDQRVSKTEKRLNLPLIPLTEPRKISVSLGNILRAVELPDGSQRPASHELEANLDSYFRATGQQPHQRPVWAFLTNKSGAERSDVVLHNAKFLSALVEGSSNPSGLQAMWEMPDLESSAQYVDALYQSILLDGGKLQRILSGGGGWGNKAGLLALDPRDSLKGQSSMGEEISQFSSAESEYTHVQFFTTTNSPAPHLFGYRKGFHMGVVPDGTPKWVSPWDNPRHVYSDSFAALSSQAMGYRADTSIRSADFSLPRQQSVKDKTQTKVDAPFASFTYLAPNENEILYGFQRRPRGLLELGRSALQDGNELLKQACRDTWPMLRETSIRLQRVARVDLNTRRKQVQPMFDCLIEIQKDVNPRSLPYIVNGVARFNAMTDSEMLRQRKKLYAHLKREINATSSFINSAVLQLESTIRNSLLDMHELRFGHNFNVAAWQGRIAALHDDFVRIMAAERPIQLSQHIACRTRALDSIIRGRYHYLHNSILSNRTFVRRARAEIDKAKRQLGVPVTHYRGTEGAVAETVASELRDMLGQQHEGQSEFNLHEIKQQQGVKQGATKGKKEGEKEGESVVEETNRPGA